MLHVRGHERGNPFYLRYLSRPVTEKNVIPIGYDRSVIDVFVALLVLSFCPFDISVGVGAFVIGLSQTSSFFFCYQ